MIDHLSIGVRDIAKAKRFYDAALKPLGYSCLDATESLLGYGRQVIAFWIGATEHPVPADDKSGLHVCFTAPNRESVDAFHEAALGTRLSDAGGLCRSYFHRNSLRTAQPDSSARRPVAPSAPHGVSNKGTLIAAG